MTFLFPPVVLPMDLPVPLAGFTREMARRGYRFAREQETGRDRAVVYKKQRGTTQLVLTLMDDAPDAAWVSFFGPAALDEAATLSALFQYQPPELLHRVARGASTEAHRVWALRVLARGCYAGGGWNATLEATLRAALQSPDADSRREAAAAAIVADAARGRAL